MITRQNISMVLRLINSKDQNRIKNSTKEYCVIELHTFNTGSYTVIKLTDNYSRYKNAYYNGNCILETGEVINLLESLTN